MKHKSVLWLLALALLIIGPILTACGSGAPAPAAGPPAIPHPLEGRDDCMMCHGESGLKPFPADHAGRSNDTCTTCHQPA